MAIKNGDLKSFLEANKRETRLMGQLERHTLLRPFDERRQDILHPSDIIKPEWCALASYHALKGNYVETRDKPSLRLQSIFDEGHAIHHKWQTYIKDMGNLYGYWQCDRCGDNDWLVSSELEEDPECGNWVYKEVPLFSDKHRIAGHADGWVKGLGDDFLIEIKSIGAGTIRMESPGLFNGSQDVESAWKNIRQPFRTHILQGQVYLHLTHLMVENGDLESAPEEIVFIYELKANQDYKEFVVAYNPEYTQQFFDAALDVAWAVDNNRPPVCSIDATNGCKRCAPFRS